MCGQSTTEQKTYKTGSASELTFEVLNLYLQNLWMKIIHVFANLGKQCGNYIYVNIVAGCNFLGPLFRDKRYMYMNLHFLYNTLKKYV